MELSRRFFQNASSVLTDLLIFNNELMGVQTLVGMVRLSSLSISTSLIDSSKAFIMQAVLNPETAFFLIAAAARMGHALGLHRWLDGFGLSQPELEQRRRVFWIIYTFEKSTCFRIGRPSSINDEDIGVPLPPEDMGDEEGMGIQVPSVPGRKFYPFRATCTIALIESRVYGELYSARSWTKSPEERLNRVSRLDQELQEWKDNIPLEIRPEHTIQCETKQRFAIIMLHFIYYNCLTAIHRVSIHHGAWTSTEGETGSEATPPQSSSTPSISSPSNPRVYASYALCLSAARSTIHIATNFLGLDDDPRNCLIWIAIYFPLAASLTLFAHTVQAPMDPRVEDDLELMERTLTSLYRPWNTAPRTVANLVLGIFGDLIAIGREHLKKARSGQSTTAPIPRTLQDGIPEPEKTSVEHYPRTSVQNFRTFSPTSPFHGNQPSQDATPQPLQTSGDPMTGDSQPDFSSYFPFNFLPFDITDPDPTFMFTHDWSQLDLTGTMSDDEEFVGSD